MKNNLPKSTIIRKRDEINLLMKKGKSFAIKPIRVVYQVYPSSEPQVQILVSAPKRNFKRAVDRNRIKRLLREAYRLNREGLLKTTTESNITLHIAFLYSGKELPVFQDIQDKIILILQRLENELTPPAT